MTRIAFITNNYTPYAAGVVKSIDAIAEQLHKVGHQVIIIAPQFLRVHDDSAYVKRIPSLCRFTYKQKHMAIPWRAKHYLKKYLQDFNPDVVHVHHPFLLGAMGVRIAREMGVPVYFTYHTIYEDYVHYVPLPAWMVKPIVTRKVLDFCKKVDHIIAPSNGIKDYLFHHGIKDVYVMPSPLRKEFCALDIQEKTLTKPYQLLCVTRFTKEKNILVLFKMMEKLPTYYHLTLVGYGDQENILREQAAIFGDRVSFVIGPVKNDLVNFYKQAHIFVFPSHTDTQGIVLAESMATRTPVVSLDGIGQRDIIVQGENGFIVADADEMAAKIETICGNQGLYKKLQCNALATALNYDLKKIVGTLVTQYQN